MRYQLPQFTDMEDKIIGPFSLKQFFYLVTVPAVCYILRFFVELPYVILIGIIFFPIALLLAFYKMNGRPFICAIGGILKYIKRPQMYVWRRVAQTQSSAPVKAKQKIKRSSLNKKPKDFKKLAEILDK